MASEIPGLVSIDAPDGSNVITLHLDDERVSEFFGSLGLEVGDEKGLTDLITRALESYLDNHGSTLEEP